MGILISRKSFTENETAFLKSLHALCVRHNTKIVKDEWGDIMIDNFSELTGEDPIYIDARELPEIMVKLKNGKEL
ncbi:hypothetical protein E2P63_03800 [Candidatus Bathyarchaeota archaeon]|nr:hypothetical protein E2P63_03800 [Candidatus Bathyarchaeota archaeon]